MKFTIAIEAGNETQAYGVLFPDLQGCISAGDTLDEAISNAHEALEGYMEFLFEEGDPLPKPVSIEEHRRNPEYQDCIWAVIDFDITPYLGKSQKINVTLPDRLIKKIDDIVSRNPRYVSRSGFLAKAALDELASLNT